MLRFKSLGSGSAGNGTLVQATSGHGARPITILIDCGFGKTQLAQRFAHAAFDVDQLDAIFITHEHGDHLGCAPELAKQLQIPIWMSRGTFSAVRQADKLLPWVRFARDGEPIHLADSLTLNPFTVPHDAKEPLQLTCTDGTRTLAILTDLGHPSPHAVQHVQHCHAILLESNHDEYLLAQSKYPPFLKQRVSGLHGHLSNTDAAVVASQLKSTQLSHVVAAHLSERNNTPKLAQNALSTALNCAPDEVLVASQENGTDWLVV